MGSLMGTAFMVLLPESMQWLTDGLAGGAIDGRSTSATAWPSCARWRSARHHLFLIFEPDGLAHRWQQIKAYWKLYPFSPTDVPEQLTNKSTRRISGGGYPDA
jgi:branched-chain amino acid transport system permease protein